MFSEGEQNTHTIPYSAVELNQSDGKFYIPEVFCKPYDAAEIQPIVSVSVTTILQVKH